MTTFSEQNGNSMLFDAWYNIERFHMSLPVIACIVKHKTIIFLVHK